jgi:hypothetical protein
MGCRPLLARMCQPETVKAPVSNPPPSLHNLGMDRKDPRHRILPVHPCQLEAVMVLGETSLLAHPDNLALVHTLPARLHSQVVAPAMDRERDYFRFLLNEKETTSAIVSFSFAKA